MFCPSCGTNLPDGSAFCPNCGAAMPASGVGSEAAAATDTATAAQAPFAATPVSQTPPYSPTNVLVFGILSLALSWIFGIIFGSMAMRRADANAAALGQLSGQTRVGRILGKVGFILGIVTTVLVAVYMVLIVAVFNEFVDVMEDAFYLY